MTHEEFETELLNRGIVSSEKVTVTHAFYVPENSESQEAIGAVLSTEFTGVERTKQERSFLLTDSEAVTSALDAAVERIAYLSSQEKESFDSKLLQDRLHRSRR